MPKQPAAHGARVGDAGRGVPVQVWMRRPEGALALRAEYAECIAYGSQYERAESGRHDRTEDPPESVAHRTAGPTPVVLG